MLTTIPTKVVVDTVFYLADGEDSSNLLSGVKVHLDNDASLILSMSKLAHFSYLQNAASMKYFFQEYVSNGNHGG